MSYGTPPPPPPGYGAAVPGPYGVPPNHPRAVLILIFGILGIVCCMPFGIAAWVMGNGALREIDANPAGFQGRGMVQAGRILGIVSVVLFVLGILLAIVLFAVGATTSSSTGY